MTRLTRPYPSRQRFSHLFSCQIYDLFIYIYIYTFHRNDFRFFLFPAFCPPSLRTSRIRLLAKNRLCKNRRDRCYEIFINQFVKIYFIVGISIEFGIKKFAYKNKTIVETESSANFTRTIIKIVIKQQRYHNNHK